MELPTANPVTPPSPAPIAAPAPGAPTAAPIIAPTAAPMPAPPIVPFSRVESGVPEHPATKNSAATAIAAVTIVLLRPACVISLLFGLSLFGLALALHLLKLLTLIFDFLLLRLNLALGLSIRVFIVLHLIADHVSANSSDASADRRAREQITDRRTNDRAGGGADTCADESTLLSRREWLSRTRGDDQDCNRHEKALDYRR